MRNLLVIETITVYNDKGLKCLRIPVGTTIKGEYDGLLRGYRCVSDDGLVYMVFHHEVVPC